MLSILRLTATLPYSIQKNIGIFFGVFAYIGAKKWRTTAKKNISAAFPNLNRNQQKALIKNNFRSLGVGLIEMSIAWWGNTSMLKQIVSIEGLEHLDQALLNKNGVILLYAHFTTLEIAGRLLSLFRPIHAMHREQDNKIFNKTMKRGRLSFLESLVTQTDIRGMLKILKNNGTILYAMDQNSNSTGSVFVNFFGVPCSTTTATSKIAISSGATILHLSVKRIEHNNKYQLVIHSPLHNLPSNNYTEDTQRIMQQIEKSVRLAPEQYLWIHRRFKTQPNGLPPFYE